MRKISADYIFPIASEPIKNGIVVVDDNGTILAVESENSDNTNDIEYYKGIICPGFINTHCHLELSHLRSKISENLGMARFIKSIITQQSTPFSETEVQQAIEAAEKEMIKNGIVAVGDISNNNSTFGIKQKNNLCYHTFLEIFDLVPERATEALNRGIALQKEYSQFSENSSVVPHAPYTVSEQLLQLINSNATKEQAIISIHNQESEAENEFFETQTGSIYSTFKAMGINLEHRKETGFNSLHYTLTNLTKSKRLLLVHNTVTTKEDILLARAKNQEPRNENQELTPENSELRTPNSELYWCTCPNANLYIENRLPNYEVFIETNANVTIGTDSLASNWNLSVLDELKTITKYYPHIPLETLLLWATKNGAEFLGFQHKLGTIEKGKRPGLNLLTNVDGLKISPQTQVKRLV